MKRAYYSRPISVFLHESPEYILGCMGMENGFSLEITQRDAWLEECEIMRTVLQPFAQSEGNIYFEFSIPRMGRRVDVVLVLQNAVFVIEFKVGEQKYKRLDYDQVYDYALDLKNFHEASHDKLIVPILVCTKAPILVCTKTKNEEQLAKTTDHNDFVLMPICCNTITLSHAIHKGLQYAQSHQTPFVDNTQWISSHYCPTPTIIEAAMALYQEHSVAEISRNDAGAYNLSRTCQSVDEIIKTSQKNNEKSICFVTGVPGAGKTLAGLNIATQYAQDPQTPSVFLSGNGPLVKILTEALVRDSLAREKASKKRCKKIVQSKVKSFVQNVHHFRDEYLVDKNAPHEHIALFDEAQRAWNREQTSRFMRDKKKQPGFNMSEPEYLISCMDRHKDWSTIICLVGGGQEINTGEAGIAEWLVAIEEKYPHWKVFISPHLTSSEYQIESIVTRLQDKKMAFTDSSLHLATSIRSFRSEKVSLFVKLLLDREESQARETLLGITDSYPLVLTRKMNLAKKWLKSHARGSERYGIVVSSRAERLKPYAIDIKSPMDPVHWFLESKEDVRSSYYLEDVATEYKVQGLELDWVCVGWDADFRYTPEGWDCKLFRSTKWVNVHKEDRKQYIKNAYRVLLTRARQGMIIVIPEGDKSDPTRKPEFYEETYNYFKRIGIKELR